MGLFKKKISLDEYVDILLKAQLELEKYMLQEFHNTFEYQGEDERLKFEVRILSLWLITLFHPSEKLRDKIHDTYCESIGISQETKDMFYKDIEQRYKNYFTAYSMWQKNPQSGHIIGTAIVETIKNQNPYFSLEKGPIPITGDTDAFNGFLFFELFFNVIVKQIVKLKKKVIVKGL
ncbi:MAG: hypothetical protein V3U54_11145 [Thermodesulfobacteriota bacterium]